MKITITILSIVCLCLLLFAIMDYIVTRDSTNTPLQRAMDACINQNGIPILGYDGESMLDCHFKRE